MLDRILPLPSGVRSTTAAAVSSQVVSMPNTSIGELLSNLRPSHPPCAHPQSRVLVRPVAFRGRLAQSSRAAIPANASPSRGSGTPAMSILVTRPHPDNEATAENLRARGHV